ncbi:hypothetical protein [Actinoplanes teichomyceticus]|uniref:hypothetical protein n=1 Tax=Actinoplanes teichomyceticus TaxID=1867 RepID=UPI001FD15D28|nr:hypothetical protein [Actinoplanes teichomyceticus]
MSGIAAQPLAGVSTMVALPAPSPPRYDPICCPVAVLTSRYLPAEEVTVQSERSPYASPAHTQPSMLWYGGAPVWSRSVYRPSWVASNRNGSAFDAVPVKPYPTVSLTT